MLAGQDRGIIEKAECRCAGHELGKQLEPFGDDVAVVVTDARDIAAGMIDVIDDAGFDGVAARW